MTEPLVAGRYRRGAILGAGGSASVYAAVDTATGAEVALKVLHPHLAERPVAREAFLQEAGRASSVESPHVVRVLDHGIDGGDRDRLVWMALERAPGESLAALVARRGPLPVAEAAGVLDAVLAALEAVHAAGLVHRDVTPANVLVATDADGSAMFDAVRLIDFGLAAAPGQAAVGSDELLAAEASGREGIFGNADYVSPEQASGAPVDARGDLYQSGALLFFALTGEPPFRRESTAQTLQAHVDDPAPAPSGRRLGIPRAVDRVVARALLKAPLDRFATAGAMRAALGVAAYTPASAAAGESTVAVAATSARATRSAHTPARVTAVTRVLGGPPVLRSSALHAEGLAVAAPIAIPAARRAGAGWVLAGAAAVLVAIAMISAYAAPIASVATPDPSPEASVLPSPVPTEPVEQPVRVDTGTSVPELAGLSLTDARDAIAAAGLTVGDVGIEDSPHRSETVFAVQPEPGVRVEPGTPVRLTVASGYNPVPAVRGLSREDATAVIAAAGFSAGVSARDIAGFTRDEVVGTEPGDGGRLWVGSTVVLVVATGPVSTPTPTPRATPTPTHGATPTPTPTR